MPENISWDEVANTETFKGAKPEDRFNIANNYFKNYLETTETYKSYDADNQNKVKTNFFKLAGVQAPVEATGKGLIKTIGGNIMDYGTGIIKSMREATYDLSANVYDAYGRSLDTVKNLVQFTDNVLGETDNTLAFKQYLEKNQAFAEHMTSILKPKGINPGDSKLATFAKLIYSSAGQSAVELPMMHNVGFVGYNTLKGLAGAVGRDENIFKGTAQEFAHAGILSLIFKGTNFLPMTEKVIMNCAATGAPRVIEELKKPEGERDWIGVTAELFDMAQLTILGGGNNKSRGELLMDFRKAYWPDIDKMAEKIQKASELLEAEVKAEMQEPPEQRHALNINVSESMEGANKALKYKLNPNLKSTPEQKVEKPVKVQPDLKRSPEQSIEKADKLLKEVKPVIDKYKGTPALSQREVPPDWAEFIQREAKKINTITPEERETASTPVAEDITGVTQTPLIKAYYEKLAELKVQKAEVIRKSLESCLGTEPPELWHKIKPPEKIRPTNVVYKKSVISVKKPFLQANAPQTARAAINLFGTEELWTNEGLAMGKKAAKKLGYNKEAAADAHFVAENLGELMNIKPELRENVEVVSQAWEQLQKKIKLEYEKRGEKFDFVERMKQQIENELAETPKTSEKYAALEAAQRYVQGMKYVHIPSALMFENSLYNDPIGTMSKLKLTGNKKRGTFKSQDLIDEGLATRQDFNIIEDMASYTRKAGRDIALLDFRNAAKSEGLGGFDKAPNDNYVKISNAPMFGGKYWHRSVADFVRDYQISLKGRGPMVQKYAASVAAVKIGTFYNFVGLTLNNVAQGMMMGSIQPLAPSTYKHLYQAIKDVYSNSELYKSIYADLTSKPFISPFKNWKEALQGIQQSPMDKLKNSYKMLLPHKGLKAALQASYEIGWQFDSVLRMQGFHYLKSKGYNNIKAAETVSNFMGNYADIPIRTRQTLDLVFFTPTYKLAMAKLYYNMVNDTIQTLGTPSYREMDPEKVKNFNYTKGLVGLLAVNMAKDALMTVAGYERDEWGRKYHKTIETSRGPKELVVLSSDASNMVQRYVGKVANICDKRDPTPWLRKAFRSFKWEFQPALNVLEEAISGIDETGEPIYSPVDDWHVQVAKQANHFITGMVPVFDAIEKETGLYRSANYTASREEIAKNTSKALRIISSPYLPLVNTYVKTPNYIKVQEELDRFGDEMNRLLMNGQLNEAHIKNFQKRVSEAADITEEELNNQ